MMRPIKYWFLDQTPGNIPFNSDSEPEDEDSFDLRDISSDVEVDPEELDLPSGARSVVCQDYYDIIAFSLCYVLEVALKKLKRINRRGSP